MDSETAGKVCKDRFSAPGTSCSLDYCVSHVQPSCYYCEKDIECEPTAEVRGDRVLPWISSLVWDPDGCWFSGRAGRFGERDPDAA